MTLASQCLLNYAEPVAQRRSGRRPGESRTRNAILAAARESFAGVGYHRATLRAIAADADVDPALVVHFFGSKQQLFLEVMELPFDPGELVRRLADGPRTKVGERVAAFALEVLEDPEARARWTGMVRAAASEPEAAGLLRELVTTRVFHPLAEALGGDDAALRANLASTQMIGLVMARYIVEIEPLASAESATVERAIAPTLQRYLVGDL